MIDTFPAVSLDGTATQNVTIIIHGTNDAPLATDGVLTTAEDVAGGGTLAATDVDTPTLTYSIVTNASHGSVTITNVNTGAYTYTPATNYNRPDSFTFRANDGTANSSTATVTIPVTPVNNAPVAADGSLLTNEDTAGSGTLAATDFDTATIVFSLVNQPSHGTVVIINDVNTGAYTYTPAANYNGSDSFTFKASDGSLNSNVATVSVTVAAVNDRPSFTAGPNQTVLEDISARVISNWATDLLAGPNEATQAVDFILSNNNNALFSVQPAISSAGTLTYTLAPNANGQAIVTVQIHDDGGVTNGGMNSSVPITFTIDATAVNDVPSYTAGPNITLAEGSTPFTQAGWATALSTGPADESTQTLSFLVSVNQPALFTVAPAISPDGSLTFTPAPFANGTATVTVRIKDNGGTTSGGVDTSTPRTFTIRLTPVNDPPTALDLSNSTIVENVVAGTSVGQFTTTDPDTVDTFVYSLVAGAGDTDNATFSITGDTLFTNGQIDFDTHPTYSIRVRSQDSGGTAIEKSFTLTAVNVNEGATLISLSSASVPENQPVGTQVGLLQANDPDSGEVLLFELVPGSGATNNALFTISGSQLRTAATFNREMQASYSIRVRVTDSASQQFEQNLTIQVANVNEAPTNITLNSAPFAESQPVGTEVGSFSTADPDQGDSFTYALVTGLGSTDNDLFQIDNGTLFTNAILNFETKPTYAIRVSSTDAAGLKVEKTFTITLTNVNEIPTSIGLSATSVSEGRAVGALAAILSTTDSDSDDTFTYSLVPGNGADGNASFLIVGDELRTNAIFDFEVQASYSIRVRSTDAGGLSVEKTFTITIADDDDAPVVTLTPGALASTGRLAAIDPGATLQDQDSTDFNGGRVKASIGTGAQSTDILRLIMNGKGPDRLKATKSGSLKLGKQVIGSVTGGRSGSPLEITFTTSTPLALVERVMQHIGFQTRKSSTGSRTVQIQVFDNTGIGSDPTVSKDVTVG